MPDVLATVTFEHASLLPRDRIVNTFCFHKAVVFTDADAGVIRDRLEKLYSTIPTGQARTVGSYMSSAINRASLPTVRLYQLDGRLDGSPAGSPIYTKLFVANITAASATTFLPAEVACVASFHSDYGSDVEFAPGARPRSRDRGRIYVGPLATDTLSIFTPSRVGPSLVFRQVLLNAVNDLRVANDAIAWSVWSRRRAATAPVTSVSVDDAFDIQRRRGERATSVLRLP